MHFQEISVSTLSFVDTGQKLMHHT